MATDLEQWWVQRAHRLLRNEKHAMLSRFYGGSPAVPGLEDPDLRWPGYLGDNYVRGLSVLAIGNIHCGFRSKSFDPTSSRYEDYLGEAVDDALAATRELKNAEQLVDNSADAYLNGIRRMYEYGLSGSWTIGDTFRKAFDALDVGTDPSSIRDIAYVNASCCQLAQGAALPDRLFVECLTAHNLADLVRKLRPIVIVTCSTRAFDHLDAAGVLNDVTTVCFSQQLGSRHLARPSWIGNTLYRAGRQSTDWPEPLREHWARQRELRVREAGDTGTRPSS